LRCDLLNDLVALCCKLRRISSRRFLIIIYGVISIANIFKALLLRATRIVLFGILLHALCLILLLSLAIKKLAVIFRMTKIVAAIFAGNPWSIIISLFVFLTMFIVSICKSMQGIILLSEHNEVVKEQNVDMNTCSLGELTIEAQRLIASYVGGTIIVNNQTSLTLDTCDLCQHIYPNDHPGRHGFIRRLFQLMHGDVPFTQPPEVERQIQERTELERHNRTENIFEHD